MPRLVSRYFGREVLEESALVRNTFIAIVLLMIGLVISTSAAFLPPGETKASWFQRYGSILTIYGVYFEMMISTQVKSISSASFKSKFHRFAKFIAHTTLVLGTIIWGYGDLIYLNYF